MYTLKGSMGARVGAFFLDALFLNLAFGLLAWVSLYLYWLLLPFGTFLYYGLCEGSSLGASPGKRICGLIVVDEAGMPLDFGQAFLRSLCRCLSALILGIGFLIGLFDAQGRALHDRLAKTFVAARTAAPQAGSAPQAGAAPQAQSVKGSGGTRLNPQLIGVAGQFAGRAFPVSAQGVLLGRDQASCDFTFPEQAQGISRNHCKLQFNPQTQMFVLYDLGSSYGTFLGTGVRVPQGQPMALRSGDEFYLASRANLFRVSL